MLSMISRRVGWETLKASVGSVSFCACTAKMAAMVVGAGAIGPLS
jgi:hypothetical protein